ncbi:hypothetical protein JW835_03580 [bacterium]|nr:hypothetical protein [bacterium]
MKLIKGMQGFLSLMICLMLIISGVSFGQLPEEKVVLSEDLSEALSYFDRSEYETAIVRLIDHAKKFAAESGIAYYFVAESHYNLALAAKISKEDRIQHLESVIIYLNSAVENGLEESYPEKSDEVVYKRAWANFRLSELTCQPLEKLSIAYNNFDFIAGGLEDHKMTPEGAYMSAEVLIQKSMLRRIELYRSVNAGERISIAKDIIQDLRIAQKHLEDVVKSSIASQYLQACAKFQLQNIQLILAKTNAKLKPEVYQEVRGGESASNGREAAVKYLQSLQFETVNQNLSQAMAVQFHPLIQYSKTYATIFEYLITGEQVFEVNIALDSLPRPRFRQDYLFFQANRDHKADIQEQRFIQLAKTSESYYYEVSTIYPEALYWLGWVQYISGEKDSKNSFQSYLSVTGNDACDLRVNFLREDAQMRLFYLTFDHNATNPGQLKSLKQALSGFNPTVPSIKKERNLLLSLTRVGLGEQAGSIFSNVDEVVELIRYMLPKAALVYGQERAQYLKYLDSLLKITQYQKSDQTKFFQGIVAFLRAEIQPEDQQVLKFYKQAADIMETLEKGNNKYQHEARYIIARAYFDAAKHESDKNEKEKLYRKAKEIFVELIQRQKSLRSLFYLAEIFIHENNHLAAAECYQSVINTTCRIDGGEFWCASARAGLRNSRNRGDLGEIRDIPIDNVEFPENLNKVDNEEITLEQFGYQKYVMKKLWAESIDRLIQFGLPNRMLYPAENRISDSRFAQRDFGQQTAGLSEQIIGLKSGLVLNVVLPQDLLASEQGVLVFYNGKLLPKERDGYRVEDIPLNEKALLEIRNDRCYVYRKKFRFTQPRQMHLIIPLIQKFRFRRINHIPDIEKHTIHFPGRLDKNTLFVTGHQISESSELYYHFNEKLNLRDLTIAGDRILAVKDSATYLLQYHLDGSIPDDARDRTLPLYFPASNYALKSPEGVAVDSSGHIYITDVDQNQLFIFDSNGRFRSVIGNIATVQNDTIPKVSFFRPKRVALAEDYEGVNIGDTRVYRPVLLFVTDRTGIHVTNQDGDVLEHIPNTEDQKGIFYDLIVQGYGKSCQLFVWNRQAGHVEWFKAEPVK